VLSLFGLISFCENVVSVKVVLRSYQLVMWFKFLVSSSYQTDWLVFFSSNVQILLRDVSFNCCCCYCWYITVPVMVYSICSNWNQFHIDVSLWLSNAQNCYCDCNPRLEFSIPWSKTKKFVISGSCFGIILTECLIFRYPPINCFYA